MKLVVNPSPLRGTIDVPGSKSHTIRALVIAALAEGRSEIEAPLDSSDTRAAVEGCRALGAKIETGDAWIVEGTGGSLAIADNVIDVGNSGTTLYVLLSAAALVNGCTVFTGDEQIRRRPARPLIDALNSLGAEVVSTRDNGMCPIVVRGPMTGGRAEVRAVTSQYVTSLLLNCPLSDGQTEIVVTELNEQPYVEMTLDWLSRQGIEVRHDSLDRFVVPGRQRYRPVQRRIPADFSSATFFLVAAAVTDADVLLRGLDMEDTQGDKAVVHMLGDMGAGIDAESGQVRITRQALEGREIDMNATPDALPAMAVAGCFATGTTKLLNVPQARVKETDRITVMREELSKMGARVEELEDGLIVHQAELVGARVNGRGDHRVVMALAVAGLAAKGVTEIETAEAIDVTFPSFVNLMRSLGASIEMVEN